MGKNAAAIYSPFASLIPDDEVYDLMRRLEIVTAQVIESDSTLRACGLPFFGGRVHVRYNCLIPLRR